MPSWPSMTLALSTGYTFGQVTQYQLTGDGAFSNESALSMLYQLGLEAERS